VLQGEDVETVSTPRQSILAMSAAEHALFVRVLDELVGLVDDGDLEAAQVAGAGLMAAVVRHIRAEEESLFPIFMRWAPGRGPAYAMMIEHRAILDALDEMRGALAHEDRSRFRVGCARLQAILPGHFSKEERVLFPVLDETLGPEAAAALIEDLRSGRSDAETHDAPETGAPH
jgi:iron-sulfur cluster repair protein YtfE (RIC family)